MVSRNDLPSGGLNHKDPFWDSQGAFESINDRTHPDHDAAYQVEGIGGTVVPAACDLSVIDAAERVTDEESFAMTGRLLREEGLLVGGSSGTAVVAALRVAARGCDGAGGGCPG